MTVDGERDVLGLWAGEHGDGEGAKYWQRVLSEIKNRGVGDVLMVVCDGLTGLPDAIGRCGRRRSPRPASFTCCVTASGTPARDWAAIARDLKPVYTAASESAALDAFVEFSETWEKRYPAIVRLWENAWAEFVPFLPSTERSGR